MEIGIDVDGVLTNIEKYQLEKGSIFFDKYNKKIVDQKGYVTTTIFDVSSELYDLFWNEYYRDYCTNSCCREYANDVINKLKNEDIYDLFDNVYVSSICETSKNEEKFFDMVINDYNIKESEALFLDDFEDNLEIVFQQN